MGRLQCLQTEFARGSLKPRRAGCGLSFQKIPALIFRQLVAYAAQVLSLIPDPKSGEVLDPGVHKSAGQR